jgi:hypothetical protein
MHRSIKPFHGDESPLHGAMQVLEIVVQEETADMACIRRTRCRGWEKHTRTVIGYS